jgi:hypothetical protein
MKMRFAEVATTVALCAALFDAPLLAQTTAPPPASAASLPVVPVAPATQPLPPDRWNAEQIRQAFDLADSNSDGQLSRQEAQRLAIMPRSFEDMDQNKDGVVSRAEFEASFAR